MIIEIYSTEYITIAEQRGRNVKIFFMSYTQEDYCPDSRYLKWKPLMEEKEVKYSSRRQNQSLSSRRK